MDNPLFLVEPGQNPVGFRSAQRFETDRDALELSYSTDVVDVPRMQAPASVSKRQRAVMCISPHAD